MPDVSKYAARDKSMAQTAQYVRRLEIARQIPELPPHQPFIAFWLFCRHSGFRRVTDITWIDKHIAKGESVAHFRARLWCGGCKAKGCFAAGALSCIIPANTELRNMGLDRRDPKVRELYIEDQYRDMYV